MVSSDVIPTNDNKIEGVVLIVTVDNYITLNRVVKIAILLKFLGDLVRFEEFISKVRIYIDYNIDSFDEESNKTTFVILYLEGKVFDFVSTYLDDYYMAPKLR